MGEMFKPALKKLWDKWNIRSVIILSLFLQTILIFFAPSRKRSARKLFLTLIWSSYLLADWAADYAVGQISDSQANEAVSKDKNSQNSELLAFWSPFLLLHLGGPDTITALAMEDNELWNRHLFSLICQALATVYVILLSIPNTLLIPTAVMLVGGVIKYVERTTALFSASLDNFKDNMLEDPNPGANYAKLMEEYDAKRKRNMPTEVIGMKDVEKGREANTPILRNNHLTPLQIVQYAYKYFNIFKGLIVDLIFTNQQRDESRKFFDTLTAEETLSIIEVELGLIYDSLFTKAGILHNKIGVVFRFLALGCLIASLYLFKITKKDKYDGFDVVLTYALLICGIALDSIALLMFFVSDWTIALRKLKEDLDEKDTCADRILNWILSFKTLKWRRSIQDGHEVLDRKFMYRRWSEYVHAYNIIGFCLRIRPKRIHHTKGMIHSFFDKIIQCLHINIAFDNSATVARQFGHHISNLSKRNPVIRTVLDFGVFLGGCISEVLEFFGVKDFYEEIMFTVSDRLSKDREFSKILSDYMMYLLMMQPTLMSAVSGIAKIRFGDTCQEAKEFFKRRHINKTKYQNNNNLVKEACEAIRSVNTDVSPISVKGDKSKSVLFDASILAKELKRLSQKENIWEVVSKVWVELLCYAATHCDSKEHASQLSKGGELINFVWLLMAHFGFGDQFQVSTDDARAKLIVAN